MTTYAVKDSYGEIFCVQALTPMHAAGKAAQFATDALGERYTAYQCDTFNVRALGSMELHEFSAADVLEMAGFANNAPTIPDDLAF